MTRNTAKPSKGERGKFYSDDAEFVMPIYLKPEVLAFFLARAKEEGTSVEELLNGVLENDIQRMKAGTP